MSTIWIKIRDNLAYAKGKRLELPGCAEFAVFLTSFHGTGM
jgi:hypothetical protein